MMEGERATIDEQLRDMKFQQRLAQIALVSRHDNLIERSAKAIALLQELAMHRLFDRFTHSQQEELLDLLGTLAVEPGSPAFGVGAFTLLEGPVRA